MKTILICDDNLFMRVRLRDILEKNGFEVIGEADNGQTGYELYRELHPDLVTMDITMPGVSGLEGLQKIIAYDDQANVIMVSAIGNKENLKDSIKYGAKDFIVKPFNEAVLIQTIQHIFGVRKSVRTRRVRKDD